MPLLQTQSKKSEWLTNNIYTFRSYLQLQQNSDISCPTCTNEDGWAIPDSQPEECFVICCAKCGHHLIFNEAIVREKVSGWLSSSISRLVVCPDLRPVTTMK